MALPLPKQFTQEPGGIQGVFNALAKQSLENQYYAPNIQSEIANRNALTQGYNIENQYKPQMLQANINSLNAGTNKTNTMTPLEAENQRNINAWYDRTQAAELAQKNAMAHYYQMGGAGMGTGAKEENYFQNSVSRDNPQLNGDPVKVYEAANALRNGQTQLADGTPLNPLSPASRESYDRLVKYGNTAQGMNQQRSANILDSLLNRGTQLIPSVSKFAGLAGKAGQTASALGASMGANDPDYVNFQIFTRQVVPQLANQMILTEGARANNTQKAMMMRVANPAFWDSNPQAALKEWNYLTDTFKQVSSVVAKSPSETNEYLKSGAAQSPQKSSKNSGKATLRYNPVTGDLEPI